MTDIPTISFNELIKRVKRLGFIKLRQKGSHVRFAHPDGRKTIIPDHGSKDVPKGLVLKILRHDLEVDIVKFFSNRNK